MHTVLRSAIACKVLLSSLMDELRKMSGTRSQNLDIHVTWLRVSHLIEEI